MGDATVGTVTVLFTDLVDSTRLLQLGADVADDVRRAHFDDVSRCVEAHRGVVVKNTGDGIMATFASAGDAVTAAEIIQQTVDHRRRIDPRTCAVRVGIASGEASHEGDDWFGAPVILAARLCAVAESNGILVTSLVRLLMDGRGGHRFVEQGAVHLKGFDESVEVAELLWDHWQPPDLPAPAVAARSADRAAFVGRSRELRQLLDSWKDAESGTLAVVVVGGEPGMGKTRLLGELAAQVHESQGRVLWGRCDDDAVVPFQPWIEIVRQALATDDSRALLADHPTLRVLLPELDDGRTVRPSRSAPPPGTDLELERMQLFDGVSAAIADLAAEAPLLVVLDDLHWAAPPSLLLLRRLIHARTDVPVLLVASYRDNEVDRRHPMAELLADLGRHDEVRRCSVKGLDEAAVLELVRAAVDADGRDDDRGDRSALATAVHRETGGNPFFVGQVLSHLAELGELTTLQGDGQRPPDLAELGVPDGVREVIGRRLARLSDAADRALVVAAIVGAQFDLDALETIPDAGTDGSDLLDALDEALAARLIDEVDGSPGRYAFAHALVRQTLLADLSITRRARLHRHVAESMSRRQGRQPAVLAEHYCAGVTTGAVEEALYWSAVAADAAIEGMAPERAIVLLERALAASDLDPTPDRAARATLWLLMANARQWIGETTASKDAADRATEDARAAGDVVLFADAAARRAGWTIAGSFDLAAGDLLTEAIEWLGDDRPDLRSRLLSVLALHRSVSESRATEAAALADEAVELAREVGDPDLLAGVIATTVVMHTAGPDIAVQRALIDELRSLHPHISDVRERLNAGATLLRMTVVLDMQEGKPTSSHEGVAAYDFLVTSMLQMWTAMYALFDGRMTDAQQANDELLPFIGSDVNTANSWAAQLFRIRREHGRAGELVPLIDDAIERTPGLVALRSARALALVDDGQLDRARVALDELAADEFAAVPSDSALSSALADLTEVAAHVGDDDATAALHRRLRPFGGQLLVVSWGVACLGAADRHLAMLEARLGRHDEAEAHLAAALALEEHAGGRPAAARTRLWWGDLLLQRREGDDLARARDLLATAAQDAAALGMAGIVARAGELLGATRS